MARVDVLMPQMGESIAEGTLSKWLKKVGDPVKRDEPLFEISTDKVDAEIPAPAAGVLAEIKVQEGQTVPVQTLVAVLETEKGATAPAPAKPESPKAAAAPKPAAPEPAVRPSGRPAAPGGRALARRSRRAVVQDSQDHRRSHGDVEAGLGARRELLRGRLHAGSTAARAGEAIVHRAWRKPHVSRVHREGVCREPAQASGRQRRRLG